MTMVKERTDKVSIFFCITLPVTCQIRRVGEVQPGAAGHGRHRGQLHLHPQNRGPENTGTVAVTFRQGCRSGGS